MLIVNLFIAFFKIGLISFGGGYAALPVIEEVIINDLGWINLSQMTDLVSMSQMTPGPIALNAASFVGMKIASVSGAIIASVATVLPQSFLMYILGKLKFNAKKNTKILDDALEFLRPGVIGLITVSLVSMFKESIFSQIPVDFFALMGFVTAFLLYVKKTGILKIVLIAIVESIILYLIFYC